MTRLAESAGRKEIEKQKRTDQASAEEKSELYLVSFPNEMLKVEAARTHTYTQKRWTRQNEPRHVAGYKLTHSERGSAPYPPAARAAHGAASGALSDPQSPCLQPEL